MNDKVKFEMDTSAVGQLLKSKEMQDVLSTYGEAAYNSIPSDLNIHEKTGDPLYVSEEKVKKTRAVYTIKINNSNKGVAAHAKASNLKHNTLVKALNAARNRGG